MKIRSANSILKYNFKVILFRFLTKYGKILPNDFIPALKNEAAQINVINKNNDN